jgi:hypothetical protein
LLIEPQFEDARAFGEGLAPVKVKGQWGFVDKTGKIVIAPRFQDAASFHGWNGWSPN